MKLSSNTFHYSLAVTCALLLSSPVAADEGSVSPSIWEFTIEPKPMIYKSGNVTYGNRLFMLPPGSHLTTKRLSKILRAKI
jgi:hypothetical protein